MPRQRQLALDPGGLPGHVERELTEYLRCGVLAHGFARVRCTTCHEEIMVAFSCKRRGLCPSCTAPDGNAADLMFVLTMAKPGQEARITYVRDGKTYTVTATYGKPRSRK